LYRLGSPAAVLEQLRHEGVEWIVTDPQVWHLRDLENRPEDVVFRWWSEFEDLLASQSLPARTFSHMESFRWAFLVEGPGAGMLPEMGACDDGRILVYRLQSQSTKDNRGNHALSLGRK
jgi:hypothetical protein